MHVQVLAAKVRMKGLLSVVTHALEFQDLPIRPGEEDMVRSLILHAHTAVDTVVYADPKIKANALLQVRCSFFSMFFSFSFLFFHSVCFVILFFCLFTNDEDR